jgi:hypothetical protein
MPSSKNRYARAQARAKYRKPKRRGGSMGWNVAIVVIVLAGIGILLLTLNERNSEAAEHPLAASGDDQVGDHWHELYGVNICGEWLGQIPEFETRAGNSNVGAGIHTHADGYIHIHPFTTDEEGKNATLGRFWEYAGLELGEDEFSYSSGTQEDPDTTSWQNGDECPNGKPGVVRWEVNGEEMTGNPADLRLADGDCLAIGFLPEGKKLGNPPQVAPSPTDTGSESQAFTCPGDDTATTTSVPGQTTVPGATTTPGATTPATDPTTTPTSGAP